MSKSHVLMMFTLIVRSGAFPALAGTGLDLVLDRRDADTSYPLEGFTVWVRGHLTGDACDGLAGYSFDLAGRRVEISSGSILGTFDVSSATVTVPGGQSIPPFVDDPALHLGFNNPAGFGGTPRAGELVEVGGAQDTMGNAAGLVHPFPLGPVREDVAVIGSQVLAIVTLSIPEPPAGERYELVVKNFRGSVLDAGQAGPTYLCSPLDPVAEAAVEAEPTGACCLQSTCTSCTSAHRDCLSVEPSECSGAFVCDVAELVPEEFVGCYGDADGNGTVNAGDRGYVSVNLNSTKPIHVCLYDMDGNGFINAADRGFVGANVGLCIPLPDWQNGSGLNHGVPDTRFMDSAFGGQGSDCPTAPCP